MFVVFKYAVTSAIVVAISEIAKRSDRLGGVVAALPVVTFLTLIWLYVEDQPQQKIANHAFYTFWYVLPTLPMFLVFPDLLARFGFWVAIAVSCFITAASFLVLAIIVRYFGINLI